MEPLISNGKSSIPSSVLLLSVAPGRRHQALAVNHCHPLESWQMKHSPNILLSESNDALGFSFPGITTEKTQS